MAEEKQKVFYPETIKMGFDLSILSYDTALKRIDAWDKTMDTILALLGGLSLAIIGNVSAMVLGRHYSFYYSVAIFLSLLFAFIGGKIIWTAKSRAGIWMVSPKVLYEKYSHLEPYDFQFWFFQNAGQDFAENKNRIDEKAKQSTKAIIAFILSIVTSVIIWYLA